MDILELQSNNNSSAVRAGAGLAFANNLFYVTMKNSKKIAVFDSRLMMIEELCCEREYNSICFDSEECCFWASCKECHGRIFKLNMRFAEIDCLAFNSYGAITGVSHICNDDTLAIAIGGKFYKMTKCGEMTAIDIFENVASGVAAAAPWVLVTGLCGCRQIISAVRYNEPAMQLCVARGDYIEAIVFADICNCASFYCLATNRGGYSRICRCNLPQSIDIFDCNFGHGAPGGNDCCGNDCCGNDCCGNDCCGSDCCGRGCPCCREDSETNIIESVALIEAALAHIINAEGEKLQKVIACSSDPEVLLAVNKSVRETIVAATHLEHVLYDKLSLVERCD